MNTCPGCGGVVGRDCWNPSECEWISRDMEYRAAVQQGHDASHQEMEAWQHRAEHAERERDHLAAELAEANAQVERILAASCLSAKCAAEKDALRAAVADKEGAS